MMIMMMRVKFSEKKGSLDVIFVKENGLIKIKIVDDAKSNDH